MAYSVRKLGTQQIDITQAITQIMVLTAMAMAMSAILNVLR